jgi:hypothetical protein
VAVEVTDPQNIGEPGECRSTANFFLGWLNSGHVGHGTWAIGDRPPVAVLVTPPQNLGEHGECGSAAIFFASRLNSWRDGDLGVWAIGEMGQLWQSWPLPPKTLGNLGSAKASGNLGGVEALEIFLQTC